ncbi:MAG: GYD domain-containing protein [candidate division Zixibacteria bacterium]|nr:GYD domain-containing protein [candidate division Zixibacteria bacterium]
MATFLMFGKYSPEAFRGIGAERTQEVGNLIKKFGGELKSLHALLGEKDLVGIVTFPGIEEAMMASVALTKLTGISFTTSPAVTVEEFDKMMADV